MQRAVCYLCLLALSACSGAGMGSNQTLPSMPNSSGETTQGLAAPFLARQWSIQVGASHDSYALQDLDFFPGSITIDAGDSITYKLASGSGGDAHTISFVPAGQKIPSPADPADLVPAGGTTIDGTKFVNSGIAVGGQSVTFTFAKAGTYKILCLFHEPAMVSTVIVQRAGAYYPHDQNYYSQVDIPDEWSEFGAASGSVRTFPFKVGGRRLAAGIDPGQVHFPPPQPTVLRFLDTNNPSKLATSGNATIKVGTALTWVNLTSNEPLTITFGPAGSANVPNLPPDPAINVASPPTITTERAS